MCLAVICQSLGHPGKVFRNEQSQTASEYEELGISTPSAAVIGMETMHRTESSASKST